MPARSKKQQMAAGAALAAKRGKRSKASLRGASRSMAESMSQSELREFAGTKRRSLPRTAKKSGTKKRSTTKRGTTRTAAKRAATKRAAKKTTAKKRK